MCGRYQLGMTWEELLAHYALVRADLAGGMFVEGATDGPGCTLPWFNQAPGQPGPTVVWQEGGEGAGGGRAYRKMRWGFAPTWVARQGRDPWKERPLVNAKAEEARDKPTWRKALQERRCLVPTTGFYEWVRRGKERFPLLFRPPGGGILTLAGIWTPGGAGPQARPCMAILTTAPNGTMRPVHDRMPVLLQEPDWDRWLDPATPAEEIDGLCRPAPASALEAVEVATMVNGWQCFGPEVMAADWHWTERKVLPDDVR